MDLIPLRITPTLSCLDINCWGGFRYYWRGKLLLFLTWPVAA